MNESYKIFLDTVTKDFLTVSDTLKQCTFYINTSQEYEYPIIVVSLDEESDIGEIVIKSDELGNKLNYFATYLDYLIGMQILPKGQIHEFKKIYDQSIDHCCLLIVHEDDAKLVFMPYS